MLIKGGKKDAKEWRMGVYVCISSDITCSCATPKKMNPLFILFPFHCLMYVRLIGFHGKKEPLMSPPLILPPWKSHVGAIQNGKAKTCVIWKLREREIWYGRNYKRRSKTISKTAWWPLKPLNPLMTIRLLMRFHKALYIVTQLGGRPKILLSQN